MENINEHDITKKMLDAIRNSGSNNSSLNENVKNVQPTITNTQPEQLDEHDMTKNMLAKIRTSQAIKETKSVVGGLLTEGYENNDVIEVDADEIASETEKIRSMVGGTEIKLYEVYPKDNNVIMVGKLLNGIEFKFSKNEGTPYINAENIRLDDKTLEIIKRLEGYYVGWVDDWVKKIDEYSQSV